MCGNCAEIERIEQEEREGSQVDAYTQRVVKFNTAGIVESAGEIVADLRNLADRIERDLRDCDVNDESDRDRILRLAANIDHELSWGFANLRMDKLHRRVQEVASALLLEHK